MLWFELAMVFVSGAGGGGADGPQMLMARFMRQVVLWVVLAMGAAMNLAGYEIPDLIIYLAFDGLPPFGSCASTSASAQTPRRLPTLAHSSPA